MEQKLAEFPCDTRVDRLLRCRKTNRYYKGDGAWSIEMRDAKKFYCELDAVRTFVQDKMNEVDLVLRIPGSQHDLFATRIG